MQEILKARLMIRVVAVLLSASNKILATNVVREIYDTDLKTAKELVDTIESIKKS